MLSMQPLDEDLPPGESSNGHLPSSPPETFRKDELLRLIMQSLQDLGYDHVVDTLQQDTGIDLEPGSVHDFRQSILQGNFTLAETLINTLPLRHKDGGLDQAYFLIREQRFLELLEAKQTIKALQVLRQEMTPLGQDVQRLHQLSSLILCSTPEEIKEQIGWDGSQGSSRAKLLEKLEVYVDPAVMIPKARLNTLLQQAREWQRHECTYHISNNTDFSLFYDHICSKRHFPNHTIQILTEHDDEVWHISFSNDGTRMASISKDNTCIIWDTKSFTKIHTLRSEQSITFGAWSPDDTMLLVCGIEHSLRLYDTGSGSLISVFEQHEDQVTCCAWLPDGAHFFSGAFDMSLILWNVNGSVVSKTDVKRLVDMKLSEDGSRLVTIDKASFVSMYQVDHLQLKLVGQFPEKSQSISLTRDGRYLLTNVQSPDEIHLWDLDRRCIVRTYVGHEQGEFVLRSTFAGYQERYILSGSEGHGVYIWSRDYQTLLDVFPGHQGRVNCVCWYPGETAMFASASDDHTIRIWGLVPEVSNGDSSLGKLEI
ncbi:WD40 repeat-like protein [Hesseltinella vesiculosa]|uniref:WD40 repeat-like protein n=1 Tax=Hesseltinella vesiculosa TaxID=101127 RepID=A0A1X2GBT3_9FUNG|nr:WD40 repeat-like protein [Hesseltinella vesiculosa]